MKIIIRTIEIKNIGIIGDAKIKIDKPLIIFYGECRQGKSTILQAVRWVMGGAFPADIIKHGEKEAFIELEFEGGSIRREFYRAKKAPHDTKARDIDFIRNGKPVDSPASELRKLLNPFQLDQDHLKNMGETERKRFLVDLFAVDTTTLDTELYNNEKEAGRLRAKISGYGDIDVTEVKPADATALQAERKKIVDAHASNRASWVRQKEDVIKEWNTACGIAQTHNEGARKRQGDIGLQNQSCSAAKAQIERLKAEIMRQEAIVTEAEKWIMENPPIALTELPDAPNTTKLNDLINGQVDTADIDAKISDAGAQNVRHQNYLAAKKRADERDAEQKSLTALETRAREIKAERIAKLKDISATCGIPELAFDESGDFTFQGTSAGMLSTSQLMTLTELLSAKYPDGFGLSLIDRGESFGKSVFSLVDRAKEEEKTILVTVVGEKPAQTPPEVGVFVVEGGEVKA